MPRKTKTPAVVELNRENQRRSRARRRDYIHDLESRLREHERQGVQATAAMQQAAWAVAKQNQALRSLLASRGIATAEIDACVEQALAGQRLPLESKASSREALPRLEPAPVASNEPHLKNRPHAEVMLSTQSEPAEVRLPNSYLPPNLLPRPYHSDNSGQEPQRSDSMADEEGSQAHHFKAKTSHSGDLPGSSCQRTSNASTTLVGSFDGDLWSPDGTEPHQSTQQSMSEHTHVRELASSPSHATSGKTTMEKSCEEAAGILAQLREGSELDDIRRDLGCRGGDACVIRNTDLLQIMDRLP